MDDSLIYFPSCDETDAETAIAEDLLYDGSPQKVILLALDTEEYDAERSLEELAALCAANHMEPVAEVLQKREQPHPATKLGAGRLAEAKMLAHNLQATCAVFDGELSGSQLRNIENALGIAVIDRTLLILEIFKNRAVTREGKTQTELAMLRYRLPRLAGLGTSLSRQGGGGGGGGGARRGGGETKLEYDRRYINARISTLKKRLQTMTARRSETRRSREKSGIPLVALVGYTNVGKSSLVNALAGSNIGEANMLFATLDPTARRFTLPDGQGVVLIDTVGFVSRLPHELVEAFKSTLEEAAYADLLLVVCNAADPEADTQLAITADVLKNIGVRDDVPRITVYNQCDRVPGFIPFDTSAIAVSAKTGAGLPELQNAMANALAARMCSLQLLLPYDKLALANELRRFGSIQKEEYRNEGVYYEATLEADKAHLFAAYVWRD